MGLSKKCHIINGVVDFQPPSCLPNDELFQANHLFMLKMMNMAKNLIGK